MSESPIIAWFSSLQNRGRVKFGVKHVLYYTELFYFSVDERAKVFYIFLCSVQKGRRTSPNPISYINIFYNHGKHRQILAILTLYGAVSSSEKPENQKLKLNEQKSKAVKETA